MAMMPNANNGDNGDIGGELAAKIKNINEDKAATAATAAATAPKPTLSVTGSPKDKIAPTARYGSKSGEQRIDPDELNNMTKPLGSSKPTGSKPPLYGSKPRGSFFLGTPNVPKTGIYQIHKGEAVVPAKQSYGEEDSDKPNDTPAAMVGSFKQGTRYVPKTGPALLHKGEAVIPKDKNMADMKDKMMASLSGDDKKPKKEIKEMHIRKTANGKHIVKHVHHHPEHHPDEEHAMEDMGALHQHMEDHAGTPNEGEGAESAPPAGAAQMTAAPSPAAPPAAGAAPTPGM